MRIAMGVEYDGTAYCGFQLQEQQATVQGSLEAALSKVADHPVRLICAGRTDTGVHATEQVIHFDTTAERINRAWVLGTNGFLPRDIAIRWAQVVSEEFHARFSALRRRYCYVIYNEWTRPALLRHQAAWHCRPLSQPLMQEAALSLLGQHDFTSYRAAACQAAKPVRTIYDLTVTRRNDYLTLEIEADGFLHHMVRNVAGVLMAIGEGSQPVTWAKTVLDARDRAAGGVTASAAGLYLQKITYPVQFQLPDNSRKTLWN